MRVFSELHAPIVGFLLGSGLATFVHCRLTLRGWGAFRRVPVTWALSASILYVTTLHFRADLLAPIGVLTFFVPTLVAEKAVRYRWFKEEVDPRYPAGLCSGLFLAAAGIYSALTYDFIPTDVSVPQKFRNLQTTFSWILVVFLPPLMAFLPSRYFLAYMSIGACYAVTQSVAYTGYPPHISSIYCLLAVAVYGTPFGVLGTLLEYLPLPDSPPKTES